jgi:hypothetical protein
MHNVAVLKSSLIVGCVSFVLLLGCGDPRTREEKFFDHIADSFEAAGLHVCQEVDAGSEHVVYRPTGAPIAVSDEIHYETSLASCDEGIIDAVVSVHAFDDSGLTDAAVDDFLTGSTPGHVWVVTEGRFDFGIFLAGTTDPEVVARVEDSASALGASRVRPPG